MVDDVEAEMSSPPLAKSALQTFPQVLPRVRTSALQAPLATF